MRGGVGAGAWAVIKINEGRTAEGRISVGGVRCQSFANHDTHGLTGRATLHAEHAGDDDGVAGPREIGEVKSVGGGPNVLAGAVDGEGAGGIAGTAGWADCAYIQI